MKLQSIWLSALKINFIMFISSESDIHIFSSKEKIYSPTKSHPPSNTASLHSFYIHL